MLDDSVLAGVVKYVTPAANKTEKDPICGECGKPLSKHFHEDREYCNEVTNGDVFTDDPSDTMLMAFIRKKSSGIYDRMVTVWKLENGH